MKKRLLSFVLSLCTISSMLSSLTYAENDNDAIPEFTEGYYQLTNAEELCWFADEVNEKGNRDINAKLTNDIDLSSVQWKPIGDGYDYANNGIVADTAYEGIFDGNGYTISNIKIKTKKQTSQDNHYETYCQGMFGIVGKNGTVKNLTIDGKINVAASGNEYVNAAKYVGGIAGINAGLISNCKNNAQVIGHYNVGGITGSVGAQFSGGERIGGKIINCTNNGDITATSTSSAHCGGIVGQLSWDEITYAANHGKVLAPYKEKGDFADVRIVGLGGIVGSGIDDDGSKISRSYNDGQIGNLDGNYIAGIIGLCYKTEMSDVYNQGTINGANYSGGLAGFMTGGSIENAYNNGEINTYTDYKLVGKAKNAKVNNTYYVGTSSKLVDVEKASENEEINVQSVQTLTADMLGDAFVDTDELPEIDFSEAPTGEKESFEINDVKIENGKITIALDKKLLSTNLTFEDFDIQAYVNGEEKDLRVLKISQSNKDDETVVEIEFEEINAETELTVVIDNVEKTVKTPKSDRWTDYRAEEYADGDGSEENPYIISNANEFALLAHQVKGGNDMSGKYFRITKDINLNGKRWIPIGNAVKLSENKYVGCAFNGVLDAGNNKITNMITEESSYAVGLFGLCEENAQIKNVTLYGTVKNTDASEHSSTGAIVGINYGTVYHCINFADVTGTKAVGGIVGKSGAVNKTVTTSYIYGCGNEGTVIGSDEVGGVCAYNSGSVDECYNKGNVTATGEYAGGIVGYNYEGSVLLANSYNSGKVFGNSYAGGISGKAYKSEIKNSYNSGKVSAVSEKSGGILGYTVSEYNTKNCYYLEGTANMPYAQNEGSGFEVKTEEELKILTEKLGSAFAETEEFPVLKWEKKMYEDLSDETTGLDIEIITVTNGMIKLVMNKSLVMTKLDQKDFTIDGVQIKGFTQSNEENKTVVRMTFTPIAPTNKEQSILISASYKNNNPKIKKLTVKADEYSVAPDYETDGNWIDNAANNYDKGNGTKEKPYIIKTAEQLALLAKTVNSGANTSGIYYKLADNLDMTEKIWTPIGTKDNVFCGNFNGNGCEVKINIDGDFEYSGLFGFTDGAEISMLGTSGMVRTSSDISGGIVGYMKNTALENCFSSTYCEAKEYAGGLVGIADSGSSIINSYAAGFINAKKGGMIFGHFANGVSVKNLYYRITETKEAIGENASSNTEVAEGKTDEYMQSDAFAYDLWLVKTKKSNGKTEKVDPLFYVGEKYPILNNNYDKSEILFAELKSPGNKLESGAEHKFSITVYGKNIDKISDISWTSDDDVIYVFRQSNLTVEKGIGKAEALVVISKEVKKDTEITINCEIEGKLFSKTVRTTNAPWTGKGTEKEPFEIKNLNDFKTLAEYVANGNTYSGVHFAITNDIDMTDDETFMSVGAWYGLQSNDGGAWSENENNRAFCGTFDGRGYLIKNAVLYAKNNHYGLFSYIGKGGEVKNVVTDSSCKLKVHNNINYIGVICGMNLGTIKSCENNADMNFTANGVYHVSGIVGQNYGTVEACKNHSNISNGGESKSGICGFNYGTIKECENTGEISNANYGGGITVENHNGNTQSILIIDEFADLKLDANILSSTNNGTISVNEDAGGITADNYSSGLIDGCENNASIRGRMAGGIAGRSYGCYACGGIKNSTNNGKVEASGNYAGGIVGEQINGNVYFCENHGEISGTEYGGGIVGRNYSYSSIGASAVDFSENYGKVNGKITGGIVGYYQDESGECYVRYNYSDAECKYGIIGGINSEYDLENTVCENTWVSDDLTDENDTAKGDLSGITLISKEETEGFDTDDVVLSVSTDSLKVNEAANIISNKKVFSSNENVISVDENGVAKAVGIGKAYVYACANPHVYSAALMSVSENRDTAEDITVSFILIGEKNLGKDFVLDKNTENTYNVWISKQSYSMKKGDTVGDLFKKALDENGIKYQGLEQGYIRSIRNKDGEWIGEYTNGKYSGWMYSVNGNHSDVGLNEFVLNGDEEVIWHYVDDYRYEVADWLGDGKYNDAGDGSLCNRWLEAVGNDVSSDEENGNHNSSSVGGGNSSGKVNINENKSNTIDKDSNEAQSAEQVFKDVESNEWYTEAVNYVYKNKLYNGISDTEFAPNEKMTRAMFVTVLYRLENEPEVGDVKFVDVESGTWYEKAIAWANSNGIVNGVSDTEFAPNENITREQTATVISGYMKYKKIIDDCGGTELDYSDLNDISDYALEHIAYCKQRGIMVGKDDNRFAPKDNATRAEAAKIFMVISKLMLSE